jgi:hypothetical protein
MKKQKETPLREWLKSGLYLPEILRDFHDQKDFFKFIGFRVSERFKFETENGRSSAMCYEGFNWMYFGIIVVDFFLWYMAMNGHTLQKSKKKLDFHNYEETMRSSREEWSKLIEGELSERLTTKEVEK